MSTSEQRLAANRANALKSTGPKSKNGKSVACLNATRHGLLSSRLLLDDEEPAEFQRLLAELDAALHPHGAVELALLERIAVAMWRQRRLVTAETAALRLQRQKAKIAGGVSQELGLGYGSELKEDDLEPFDTEQKEWCQAVIEEIEKLEEIELTILPKSAPLIFKQLKSDADDDGNDLEAHLKNYKEGLAEYVAQLLRWCNEQLREVEKRPKILATAEFVSAKRLVLSDDTLELFTRYQTTLDNQLYKALRTYRETQEWRLKTLEGAAGQAEEAAAA